MGEEIFVMDAIKYIALSALPIVAIIICRGYASFVDSAIALSGSYRDFLCHIERRLGGYMTPPRRLGEGFDDPNLASFTRMISEGRSLCEAYLAESGALPTSVREILNGYFSDFGKGELSLELRRVREAICALDRVISQEKEQGNKQKRLCAAVAPSLAVGILILLI